MNMTSLYYNGRAFILPKQALTKAELIERLEAALLAPPAIRSLPTDSQASHAEMIRNWH